MDMDVIKLVEYLIKLNVSLSVENEELLIEADKKIITDKILDEIRNNKQGIITLLKSKYRPLSFAQERLWFIDQYENNSSYNVVQAIKLVGNLDIKVLEATFLEIIKRHEVLRTNIITINNEPRQIIQDEIKFKLNVIDHSYLNHDKANEIIHGQIKLESEKPFDLTYDSLIRVILYKINQEEYILFLNQHHIISDGWSFYVLFKEISVLYKAFIEQKPSPLPELEIQYSDYSVWQRNHIQGETLQKQLEYWKVKLNNTQLIELPIDNQRPKEQTFNGRNLPLNINRELTDQLNLFSKDNDVTLYMTLLAIFKVLLYKYTGQEDICVGSPIANRTKSEIEPLIGFFVNTLALRSNLNDQITFKEFVKNVKRTTLEAYDNQDVPFEKVVDTVLSERNISYSPLVQVMIVLQNNPVSELSLGDLTLKPLALERVISKFDLTIDLTETIGGLAGMIEYNTDLFDRNSIERMIRHFQELIQSIISNPNLRISELDILPEHETKQLIFDRNDTFVEYPKEKCIHQLFEEQVLKTPYNIALTFKEEVLTYKELNERANKLSYYLCNKGVKVEDFVGICVDRSLEMIIGILGILKAGGAYVPIDPTFPQERISYMIEDANCEIVLSQKHIKLPQFDSKILYLDSDWDRIDKEPIDNINSKVIGNNLAYVIYTSGSTGKPKGTLINHYSVYRIAKSLNYIEISRNDNILQLSNYAFDGSVFDIYAALLNGSTLVLLEKEIVMDVKQLTDYIISKDISVLFVTTALFNSIIDYNVEALKSIRKILFGGELVSNRHVNDAYNILGSGKIIHVYGPTESTVFTCFHEVSNTYENTVPIGKPLDNTELYILDKNRNLVPSGVAGELYISGDGLAREYLNQPELTAKRFIKNPFKDDTNQRLYKTGDLVKYNSDGNIEFISRIDNQVKVRGFRVELNEIESNLLNHSNVEIAIVRSLNSKVTKINEIVAYIKFHNHRNNNDIITGKRVEDWVSLYDDTYSKIESKNKNEFIGWNSSFTGLPIGKNEMLEWLENTIDLIKQFKPSTILEIGSGTGLLLFELVPDLKKYYGIDNSKESINYLNEIINSEIDIYGNVELFLRGADEIHNLNVNDVDTIIINSVTQYFPNLNYFEKVLVDSMEKIPGKGFIIVGDIRNYQLMEDFFRSTELYKIDEGQSVNTLKERIKNEMRNEKELIIDPQYFVYLQKRFPRVSHVDIRYKQGKYQTEMNKYRYNVILHINNDFVKEVDKRFDWSVENELYEKLDKVLQDENIDVVSLENVPNYFLEEDEVLSQLIEEEGATLNEIKSQIRNEPVEGYKPLLEICVDNYRKEVVWNENKYLCNVLFINKKIDGRVVINKSEQFGNMKVREYSNDTIKRDSIIENINEIRKYLERKLPAFMIPSHFVSIENIPLTLNGKIDDNLLPEIGKERIETENIYVAPRTNIEQKLTKIWQDLLGVSKIGIFDNFFELGGHSLIATQLISKIRDEINVELPLKLIFQKPILMDFAKTIANSKSAVGISRVTAIPRVQHLPLSFAQERLWFIDQYSDNSAYNMPGAAKLVGRLDFKILEKTFTEIIRRHEVLRTNIITINNLPFQKINKESKFELKIIDFSNKSEKKATKSILKRIQLNSQKHFDLVNDSLIDIELYKLEKDNHVLFLNKHHIISDGWSISVLYKEISILYNAYNENKSSPLPDLEIQYADYAVWQRNYIDGDILTKQSEYWKNQLSGLPTLKLPINKSRPIEQTYNGANVYFQLNKSISEKLYAFSKDNDVTLFMTLLSLFKVLLYKYTGQSDICVGSPIANRTRIEIEPLIGFFVNTLALRTNLNDDFSFLNFVEQIKNVTLDAYSNQDIPFEKVVEITQPNRNLAYSPLFQVMMILQNNPVSELSLGELSLKPLNFEQIVSRFDLTLEFTETQKGLYGRIEYNTDLFDRHSIDRMIKHYKILIDTIILNPNIKISDIELLTSSERQQLLFDWNDTQVDYPKEKCIHQLFEEQSEKTPDNVAVVFEGDSLTYRELNERSNQLAYYLQSKGVKAESLVGICVERSLEMIVGLLGILKAGGAYVPIDPTYPEERISYMFKDTNCAIVLTQEQIELPKTNSEIIYLDSEWEKIAKAPRTNIETGVKGDNLAYVIYTSGSTGNPKGVMVEHRNTFSLLKWAQKLYSKQELAGTLASTSIAFDLSIFELYLPLSIGCSIILEKNILSVTESINKQKITFINTVPSGIKYLLDQKEIPSTVKTINLAGEYLSKKIVNELYEQGGNIKVYDLYGPSEDTTYTTYSLRTLDGCETIGQPIENTKVYILDKTQKSVPIGVVGELCISGNGLARGYLNQPDLTRKKFIKDPFSKDPNSRLYKTGDLARYLPDGNIEFIGRLDDQVKIRGFRIELGEIESVLNQQDQVSSSVVLAKEDATGNKQLVGYVVPSQDVDASQGLKIEKLREALSKTLPDYMVPSLFVSLEAMPLTSNGKIDKKALPDPQGNLQMTNEYVPPKTEIEKNLAIIWQELLGVEKVGINDNFFELGGHSLLATQIISSIKYTFNKDIPLKAIFENSILYKLALSIEKDYEACENIRINKVEKVNIGQSNPKSNKIDI
ncbi:amino acid adenylation domain-containing protein [Zhouia spongiae]|uniref:Amino acid adenylation domain-containing protein n=1 Tax=Zhouia spongiae TaxID=2202721 RepID=A0ABY3YLE7_9FLAO|nr:non-ribosomal peptide synthetase [Zhouia spongiae]UNY98316.1 amino acid adenylation domain-containing protein [Zhouia spongiae]